MAPKKTTKVTTSRKPAARTGAAKPASEKATTAKPASKASAAKSAAKRSSAGKKATTRVAGKPTAAKPAVAKAAAKKPIAKKPAAKKAAGRRPVEKKAAGARRSGPKTSAPEGKRFGRQQGTDPEGFFVARVRGEDAVRDAPRSLLEGDGVEEEPSGPASYDERLGDLPWSYGDDLLMALPRDPHTLFLYWDHSQATMAGAFEGLDHPHAQIWLFARGAGWDRVRTIDFALEARGYYLHDLEPGRVYRVELHLIDRRGQERLLAQPSNSVALPPVGASPVVDDRFATIPWGLPLPRLLGPGVPGGPFSDAVRDLLARLSDWNRLQAGGSGGGEGPGGRPTSQGGPPVGAGQRAPTSPSSPFGPFGGEGR